MNKQKGNVTIVVLVAAVIIGVVYLATREHDYSPAATHPYKKICLDGVVYWERMITTGYKGFGSLAVKYNVDGSIDTCTNVAKGNYDG